MFINYFDCNSLIDVQLLNTIGCSPICTVSCISLHRVDVYILHFISFMRNLNGNHAKLESNPTI